MTQIRLDGDRWDVRWFVWSAGVLDEFWPLARDFRTNAEWRGTNLCQYVRTLFFGAMVALLHVALVVLWVSALVLYPIYAFGLFGYGSVVGVIVTVIAAVTLVVFLWKGLRALGGVTSGYVHSASRKARVRRLLREDRGPGLTSLLWQWLVAQKMKICPTITFVKRQNVEESHV